MPKSPNDPIRGDQLRRKRERLGLSVVELAAKASTDAEPVSPESLRTWELGYYAPSDRKRWNLAAALGIGPDELLLPANAPRRLRQLGPPARRRSRS